MKATQEQYTIMQVARDGHDLTVNAGPGTGKTTLIGMVGRDHPGKNILNLCFNRSTKLQADQKMPSWMKNMTFHGLAYGYCGKYFAKKLNLKINPRTLAQRFGCDLHTATVAKYTLRRYATSEEGVIMGCHVPAEAVMSKDAKDRDTFREDVVTVARKTWMAAMDFKDREIGCEHDFYLKRWCEEGAKVNGRFDMVMIDEGQDMVPVNIKAMRRMYGQKVIVGDKNQQMYSWRRAVDSLEEMDFDHNLHLTHSYRFGEPIAYIANQVLDLLDVNQPKLKGVASYPSEISYGEPSEPYVLLCRSNAGLLGEALHAVRNGKQIHVIGNLMDSILLMESAWYLSIGEKFKVKHPTLQLFEDWNAVLEISKEDGDLAMAVKRVDEYGGRIPYLCEELKQAGETSYERANVVLSTVHKFKGMEADVVKLGEDFQDLVRFSKKERTYKPMKAEICVFFVAVTRAMRKLYVNSTVAQLPNWKELLQPI